MNEADRIASAFDKPPSSRIAVEETRGDIVIRIPRPRMPLGVTLAIGLSAIGLAASFAMGLMILVLNREFPGYGALIGNPPSAIPPGVALVRPHRLDRPDRHRLLPADLRHQASG
jgi:hypothetical protein